MATCKWEAWDRLLGEPIHQDPSGQVPLHSIQLCGTSRTNRLIRSWDYLPYTGVAQWLLWHRGRVHQLHLGADRCPLQTRGRRGGRIGLHEEPNPEANKRKCDECCGQCGRHKQCS